MTTRKCYQCGDDDMAEIQAARKKELRAYQAKLIEEAEGIGPDAPNKVSQPFAAPEPQSEPEETVNPQEEEAPVEEVIASEPEEATTPQEEAPKGKKPTSKK